jgi:hypothetical protein
MQRGGPTFVVDPDGMRVMMVCLEHYRTKTEGQQSGSRCEAVKVRLLEIKRKSGCPKRGGKKVEERIECIERIPGTYMILSHSFCSTCATGRAPRKLRVLREQEWFLGWKRTKICHQTGHKACPDLCRSDVYMVSVWVAIWRRSHGRAIQVWDNSNSKFVARMLNLRK